MKGSLGWRVRSSPGSGGRFFCPLEGGDRDYIRSDVRRWFAPFGIPLWSSHRLGEYVRCAECRQTFTTEVLEILTTEEMSIRLERAAVVLLSTAAARSGDSDQARAVAERELRRYVRHPFNAHVGGEVWKLEDLVEAVSAAAVNLEHVGRRGLFAAAVRVAHANGSLTSQAFSVLHAAGGALRLPVPTIRTLIISAGAV